MKKGLLSKLALTAGVAALLGACGSNTSTQSAAGGDSKKIDTLKVAFVPSKDPDQILTQTAPLKEMLKTELKKSGYDVGAVEISVGTNYNAVGESLTAGSVDVGLISGGTYVTYDQGAEVILTATRNGLSKDSTNPKDWNDGKATQRLSEQVTYYKGLVIAGPSAKGQELAKKINSGEKLTWEDLNSANWAVMSTTSSAGYIYASLWLQANFQKGITDLANVVTSDSYASSAARLASGQVDVIVAYADVRNDYEAKWTTDYARTKSIWEETNVIGVTDNIYNDNVSVSKSSKIMTDDFKKALQEAFINIAKTEEGQKVIAIYSHKGYQPAKSSDYDTERKAQQLLKSLR